MRTPLTLHSLTRALSPERLAPYSLDSDVDSVDAIARYLWNLALCSSLLPALHVLEVTLRNEMYRASLATLEGRRLSHGRVACWLDARPSLLEPNEARVVEDAIRSLRADPRSLTRGRDGPVSLHSQGCGSPRARYIAPRDPPARALHHPRAPSSDRRLPIRAMPAHPCPASLLRLTTAVLLVLSTAACMGGGGDPLARRGPRPSVSLAPGATLLIPVRGVRAEQLRDSYDAPRSGGRTHRAIDIPARRGTPVLAAADGRILKLRRSSLGGITVYQLDDDGRTVYYYAHLQRYVAGLREGQEVWRGQIIAYVGDTGNAGRGNYHLHFSVGTLRDAARWWESESTNPFPLLAGDLARGREGGGRVGGSDAAGDGRER